MNMNLYEFMKATHKMNKTSGYEFQSLRPRIVCKDGVSLSVQGSESHYSTPRHNYPMYSSVEVGYPSIRPTQEWSQYFDGTWQGLGFIGRFEQFAQAVKMAWWCYKNVSFRRAKERFMSAFRDNATDSVYGYVPVELVEDFIDQHGGIDEAKTFETK